MNYEVGEWVNEIMNVGVFGHAGGIAFPNGWKLGGGYSDDEGNGSRWFGVGSFSYSFIQSIQSIDHSNSIQSFDQSIIQTQYTHSRYLKKTL